jgi:hypothetical protein
MGNRNIKTMYFVLNVKKKLDFIILVKNVNKISIEKY